jgi:hypothetical protein
MGEGLQNKIILTINLPRPTGDMLFPILDWMSRSDICPVLSSLILAVNLEIAPLVKWSLRLPYTFLSVWSPFIEEGAKMP